MRKVLRTLRYILVPLSEARSPILPCNWLDLSYSVEGLGVLRHFRRSCTLYYLKAVFLCGEIGSWGVGVGDFLEPHFVDLGDLLGRGEVRRYV